MKHSKKLIQTLRVGLAYDPNEEKILLVGRDKTFKNGEGFKRAGREYPRGDAGK